MDENKFFSLFKNLQSVMRCPSCSSVYEVSEMQFVGSQDGYFLLSLNCSKCSLPVWVNVFAGSSANGKRFISDLTVKDFLLMQKEPITSDEVIEFSEYIQSHDGNFSRAFKKKPGV